MGLRPYDPVGALPQTPRQALVLAFDRRIVRRFGQAFGASYTALPPTPLRGDQRRTAQIIHYLPSRVSGISGSPSLPHTTKIAAARPRLSVPNALDF